jgi:RNA polymerase sigma-70 factor (ECF subfamily)
VAIARSRAGDLDAYEALVARYTASAHRTAALLGAGSDAEDIVQDAFVKAFQGLAGFRDGEPFRPWLLRIVANETRNLGRANGRRVRLACRVAAATVEADPDADPAVATMAAERRAAVLAAVNALPERDRLVVTCRYFLDLSEAETATVLGWARGTVKSRLSRALTKLRAMLAAPVGEEVATWMTPTTGAE